MVYLSDMDGAIYGISMDSPPLMLPDIVVSAPSARTATLSLLLCRDKFFYTRSD